MNETLRQHQLALVCAAREGVRHVLVNIGAAATGALVFTGAARERVWICFQLRTLLPGVGQLVSIFIGARAGPVALPASIGHVLILSYAVHGDLLYGGIAGEFHAAASEVDQLVPLLNLLLVPLVVYAGDSALFV